MKLPAYTRQEARLLEDIYISGYKAEGLWGMGRAPTNARMEAFENFNITPAGKARQERAEKNRQAVLRLLRKGPMSVPEICAALKKSDTTVRKYVRELEVRGDLVISETTPIGANIWRLK